MEWIQIIIIILTILLYIGLLISFKRKNITSKEFLLWSGIWSVLLITALYPQWLGIFKLLGLTNGINIAVYGSIILLFILVFKTYEKIDKLEQKMTKIVREIALSKKK